MIPWSVAGPWLIPMALLILCSAFFSGSEAALFSLQPNDRRKIQTNKRSGQSLKRLLHDPDRLLSAVLFWNLVINMAYFAIASIVGTRLQAAAPGGVIGLLFTLLSLLAIIFFSEMLPKSIAVKSPSIYAVAVAQPLELAIRIVNPLLPILRFANLIARRLLWPGFVAEKELEVQDIDRAIQLSVTDKAFADRERNMLRRLVSFADTRVTDLMRPRNKYQVICPPVSAHQIQHALQQGGYLFLGDEQGNLIEQVIPLRWLRPSQMDDLDTAAEQPLIVPWSTSVASVLELLRQKDLSTAAVVNEYGDNIGVITIDEILDSTLQFSETDMDSASSPDSEPTTVDSLRFAGTMSVRDLADRLGLKRPQRINATAAGLMQNINRRIPRTGDTCIWEGFQLAVIATAKKGQIEMEATRCKDEADHP